MSWWEQFAAILSEPQWTADLLASLLGALIAFVGTLTLVLRQLKHDRELVSAQLTAMSSEREAEARSAAASRLGRDMVRASEALDSLNPAQTLELLLSSRKPAGADLIYDAENEATLSLDLDSTVLDLWRDYTHTWRECRTAVHRRATDGQDPNIDWALTAAVDALMTPIEANLDVLGRALIRWNGIGKVPSSEVLLDWNRVPIADRHANAEWKKEIQNQFDRDYSTFATR